MAYLRKVKRGDPLAMPAETFNTFVDVARAHQDNQRLLGRSQHQPQPDPRLVLVRNDSGADRNRFDVLGIDGPVFTRADNEPEFLRQFALKGVAPTDDHAGRFVILHEPLAAGAIGRGSIEGVAVVRVQMDDDDHLFADIEVGEPGRLLSSSAGSTRLLWVEPIEERQTPELAYAIVRLGEAGGVDMGLCIISDIDPVAAPTTVQGYPVRVVDHMAWTFAVDTDQAKQTFFCELGIESYWYQHALWNGTVADIEINHLHYTMRMNLPGAGSVDVILQNRRFAIMPEAPVDSPSICQLTNPV